MTPIFPMQRTLTRLGSLGSKWRDGPPSFEDPPNIMRPTSEPALPPADEHPWHPNQSRGVRHGLALLRLGTSRSTAALWQWPHKQAPGPRVKADDLCLVARGTPVLEKISPKNWWDFHGFPWISVDQWTYLAIPCYTVPGPELEEDRKQLAFLVTAGGFCFGMRLAEQTY